MQIPDKYNTIFTLKFDDPELSEMEVKLRLSYGLIDSAGALLSVDLDAVKAGQAKPEDLAKLSALVDDFAGALVAWNIDGPDGDRLGTDLHTVRGQDRNLVLVLVSSFMDALREWGTHQQQQAAEVESALPVEPISG